jgi:hypothetical protein
MSRTNLLHWRTAFSVLPPCIHNTMQRAVSRAPPTTTTRIPSRALSSCDLPRPATRVSRRAALRNKSQSDSLTCAVPAWPRALRLMPWRSGGRGKRGPTTFTGGRAAGRHQCAGGLRAGLLPLLDRLSTLVIGPYRVSVQRCTSL